MALDHHDGAAYRDRKKCIGWDGKPDCAETFPKTTRRERCLDCQAEHVRAARSAREKGRRRKRGAAADAHA